MSNKKYILSKLKDLKASYENEGIILLGLFGSYAKDQQTKFSDIDVAYKLDYDRFTQIHKGGLSKLLRIDGIKQEMQAIFRKKIDLVPDSNKTILKDIIYV